MKDSCIIIVDDDPHVRKAYRREFERILEDIGHESVPLLIADSGAQALELVMQADKESGAQIEYFLMTDGDMIGMAGPDVIRGLDELLQGRLLIRIICSADPRYKEEAEKLSAFFVQKPYRTEEFISLLNIYFSMT